MANSHSFTPLSFFLINLVLYIIFFNCSSASSSSSSIASDQLKFWSQNVQNNVPESLLKKLSPLSKQDSDFYINKFFENNDKLFSADSKFCSLAKLACSTSVFNANMLKANSYAKTEYKSASSAAHHQVKKNNNEDPFSFFRLSILKTGNLVHLPNLQASLPDRAFLPAQIASKIPLTYDAITKTFPDSTIHETAKEEIQTTLSYCNAPEIKGETKSCPKSLEGMVEFAKFALGEEKLVALTSKSTKGSNTEVLIRKTRRYGTEKIVACHEAFLPFVAYYCHVISSSRLYAVEFADRETGAYVNTMMAICHMDTSDWSEDHVALEILKFAPGEGEACHWFTQLDLAWIGNGSV